MPVYQLTELSTNVRLAGRNRFETFETYEQLDHFPEIKRISDSPTWNFGLLEDPFISGFTTEIEYNINPKAQKISIINNSDQLIKIYNDTSTIGIHLLSKNLLIVPDIKGRVLKIKIVNIGGEAIPEGSVIVSQFD